MKSLFGVVALAAVVSAGYQAEASTYDTCVTAYQASIESAAKPFLEDVLKVAKTADPVLVNRLKAAAAQSDSMWVPSGPDFRMAGDPALYKSLERERASIWDSLLVGTKQASVNAAELEVSLRRYKGETVPDGITVRQKSLRDLPGFGTKVRFTAHVQAPALEMKRAKDLRLYIESESGAKLSVEDFVRMNSDCGQQKIREDRLNVTAANPQELCADIATKWINATYNKQFCMIESLENISDVTNHFVYVATARCASQAGKDVRGVGFVYSQADKTCHFDRFIRSAYSSASRTEDRYFSESSFNQQKSVLSAENKLRLQGAFVADPFGAEFACAQKTLTGAGAQEFFKKYFGGDQTTLSYRSAFKGMEPGFYQTSKQIQSLKGLSTISCGHREDMSINELTCSCLTQEGIY